MSNGIREDDFRRAWPNALALAMQEADRVIDRVEALQQSVASANKTAVEIVEMLPVVVRTFKNKTSEACQLFDAEIAKQEKITASLLEIERIASVNLDSIKRQNSELRRKIEVLNDCLNMAEKERSQKSASIWSKFFGG